MEEQRARQEDEAKKTNPGAPTETGTQPAESAGGTRTIHYCTKCLFLCPLLISVPNALNISVPNAYFCVKCLFLCQMFISVNSVRSDHYSGGHLDKKFK